MSNIQAVAGGRAGYVRAVFSQRCRGFAAPVDLVRASLRAANMLTARRHNAAVRDRLAEDFGGYLVTDAEPEAGGAFAPSRDGYGMGCDLMCVTGGDFVVSHNQIMDGGLDAPDFMAAGAMRANGECGNQCVVLRRGVVA